MCLLFTMALGMWSDTVYSNRSSARQIHYLMIVLGGFKVLTLLAQGSMYHYLRVTGHSDGWNVAVLHVALLLHHWPRRNRLGTRDTMSR